MTDQALSRAEIYFFGCWNNSEHYLRDREGVMVRSTDRLRIPSPRDLDCSSMLLPPENVGAGSLTYLPACNITVLAWWGSPFDARPGANNAILIRGQFSLNSLWHEFTKSFPTLAPKLECPVVPTVLQEPT